MSSSPVITKDDLDKCMERWRAMGAKRYRPLKWSNSGGAQWYYGNFRIQRILGTDTPFFVGVITGFKVGSPRYEVVCPCATLDEAKRYVEASHALSET